MVYDIHLGQESIGRAEVQQEGLYYRISGKCRLSGTVLYKLTVSSGEYTQDLGILVPEGEAFAVHTRVPVKRLGSGELKFRAVPRHKELRGKFVPLSPQEPFSYIKQLEKAFLEIRDGEMGINLDGGPSHHP